MDDFSAFYKSFFPRATWALMSAYAINLDTAEELVQEAMTCMYKTLGGKIDNMSDARRRGYLMTTARNKATDHWKRNSWRAPGEIPEDLPHDGAADELQAVHTLDAFERLPDDLREIAALRYLTGMSNREIAAATGINVSTVGSRLGKARKQLMEELNR